jgi:hypothetical protein
MGFFDSILNGPKDVMSPYIQEAMKQVNGIATPDIEKMKIKLQQLVQQGVITPEDAQAALVQNNAYDGLSPDATGRGAQMSALQGLQDQISKGGLSDIDRSRVQQTLDTVNNDQRGQQGAIMEDAHRRGVSGSGMELATRLMSQQHGADQAGRQGMDIAALAEQAKMEALKQAATVGGNLESQDWQEQSQKAAAQNTINQFNSTNQQQVTLANIAAHNAAQEANLREKQRMSDTNTTNENANRARNADLIQQDYRNKMDKAGTMAGLLGAEGRAAQGHEDAVAKRNADLLSGAIGVGATAFGGPAAGAAMTSFTGMGGGASTNPMGTDAIYRPKTGQNGGVLYAAHGAVVPGKAPYPGDDGRNDQVPAMLSPGEVVLPRSESQGSDYDKFMADMPRSEGKPTADAVRLVLEALSGMGC